MITEQRSITGVTKTLGYSYFLDNSLKSVSYPSGAVVNYGYTGAGRIGSAQDTFNNINYVTGTSGSSSLATHLPDGSPISYVNGVSSTFNGITNTLAYNIRLQPVTMSASAPNQTVFSIGYDFHQGIGDNGNVFSLINYRDQTRTQTFTYDALNRLTSAQNAGTDCTKMTVNGKTEYWGNSYGYDPWGNLITKTPTKCSAENLNEAAWTNNQLHTISGADNTYDAAGNMTHDATTGNNYSYDAENRITGAAGYTYIYDADGNRVEKSNGSTGTIYWSMSPGIVAESDLSGNLKSEYVFFNGRRTARRDFPGGAVSYYFSDELGTASVITNAAGTITEDEDFYPWGGELQFINSDSNHYKYGGHERDSETSLDYMLARYYSNPLGRFLTPDWAGKPITVPYANFGNPQSLNLYSYTQNNPTTLGDADGHQCGPNCFPGGAPNFAKDGKNMLIGAAKGLGTIAYNTGKAALAGATNNRLYGLSQQSQAILNAPLPGALQPSNPVQAGASQATQVVFTVATVVNVVTTAATVAVESAAPAVIDPVPMTDGVIFRSGGTNPGNITGADLSFRNSLSNPIDAADNPVFAPGDKYFGADVSKLPEGSAVLDNNPPGHVTVNAPAQAIKDAVVEKGKFPKTDQQ
jgi:RHS repeat-associated protein